MQELFGIEIIYSYIESLILALYYHHQKYYIKGKCNKL